MLETIREYGIERRAEIGDETTLREHHARHFLTLAESAPPYVPETRTSDWYERIDADLDNFRAALEWAESNDEQKLLIRFAVTLWPYWTEYQRVAEGRRWLETALTYREQQTPTERAKLLTGICTLPTLDSDYQTISNHAREALALWQRLDNTRGQALIYRQMGVREYIAGAGGQSIDQLSTALELWRAVGDPLGIACALSDLIVVNCALDNLADAAVYIAEAETFSQNVHDELSLARLHRDHGFHALLSGNATLAVTLLSEALNRFRAIGSTYMTPATSFYLGTALCFAEQLDAANAVYLEALQLHAEVGDLVHIALTLFGFAAIAHRQKRPTRAAILCAAANAMLEGNHLATPPAVQAIYAREIEFVRAQLTSEAFALALAEGQTLTLEEAIAFARMGIGGD